MAIESRMRELVSKHRDLDNKIRSEMHHPAADWRQITELKRQKLKLKEQLEALKRPKTH